MNIESRATRLIISAVVLVVVVSIVLPHLMDVQPPMLVEVLLKPAELLGKFAGSIVRARCNNIGSAEHPVCEGTPIDLFIGLAFVAFGVLLYPAVTYLLLSLLSLILTRGPRTQE